MEQREDEVDGEKPLEPLELFDCSNMFDTDNNANVESSEQESSHTFAGPTSSNFSFGVARLILEQEGGTESALSGLDPELAGSISSVEEEATEETSSRPDVHSRLTDLKDLHGLQLLDALRLIQVYHENIGILHPIVDIETLNKQANLLWARPNVVGSDYGVGSMTRDEVDHLKMVLAVALVAEGGGSNSRAEKIHESLQPAVSRVVFARNFTMRGQILLLLTVSLPSERGAND